MLTNDCCECGIRSMPCVHSRRGGSHRRRPRRAGRRFRWDIELPHGSPQCVHDPSVEGRIGGTEEAYEAAGGCGSPQGRTRGANKGENVRRVRTCHVRKAREVRAQRNEVRRSRFITVRKFFVRKVPQRRLAAMRNEAKDVLMQESYRTLPVLSA